MPAESDTEALERVRTLIGAGQLQDALNLCLPIAETGNAEALFLLAVISTDGGQPEQAIVLYEEAIKHLPERADVLYNYGVCLKRLERTADAAVAWGRAFDADPKHWQAAYNRGLALFDMQDAAAAVDAFRACLPLTPDNADVPYSLGNALFRMSDWAGAQSAYEEALKRRPGDARVQTNFGLALLRQGQREKALEICSSAAEAQPTDLVCQTNLGHALLANGRIMDGFKQLEWRRKALIPPKAATGVPDWTGGPIKSGGTLLLYGEQGHGDAIQFLRYVPLARERASAETVVVACHAPLVDLATRADGVDQSVDLNSPAQNVDGTAPLMSLPVLLGCADEDTPPAPPYITPPAPRDLSAYGDGPKIGLVWRGNQDLDDELGRSCPIEDLLPLFAFQGGQFFTLHWQGLNKDEQATITEFDNIHDLGNTFDGFDQAGEIVAGLDLLISIDTAMAHLSAAMGLETWVMLPAVEDWRWRKQVGANAWYPKARLFRQEETDWRDVATRLAEALSERF